MKHVIHTGLGSGRWLNMSLMVQLANVGSDVHRAISWRDKGDLELSHQAFLRALELISFTIADPKYTKKGCHKELVRMREVMLDYFMADNKYGSTDALWESYFYHFTYAAALERGR